MMESREKKYLKRAFSVSEAAEYAYIGRSTLEGWITKGLLPYEELPGRGDNKYRFLRIRKKDLDAFLDNHYKECIKNSDTSGAKRKISSDSEIFLLPRNSC